MSLVLVGLIIAGLGILGGKGVAMGLLLFRYPPRSAPALFAGTLTLRYCAVRFASNVPIWRLPVSGHAAGLVTAESGVVDVV